MSSGSGQQLPSLEEVQPECLDFARADSDTTGFWGGTRSRAASVGRGRAAISPGQLENLAHVGEQSITRSEVAGGLVDLAPPKECL